MWRCILLKLDIPCFVDTYGRPALIGGGNRGDMEGSDLDDRREGNCGCVVKSINKYILNSAYNTSKNKSIN